MSESAGSCSPAVAASWETTPRMAPYDWWRSIGSPTRIVAPMVEHSDLAFRMLTRKYGAQLVYTQMYNAYAFTHSSEMREQHFTTCAEDRPLIVQIAGHDPQMLLKAAQFVEDRCDAVDLNLGCPQGIAKRGRYGAFLMEEVELLQQIVSTLVRGLKIPVTCKIRIYKDFEKTVKYCEALVDAGASMLTVHGRTRDEKGHLVRAADWEMIRRVKEHFQRRAVPVPIVANGGVERCADVDRCLRATRCDGVMSSEAVLENPALFAEAAGGEALLPVINTQQLRLTEEYLRFCRQYPVWPFKGVRSHINKMLFRFVNIEGSGDVDGAATSAALRVMIGSSYSIEDFEGICQRCRELVESGHFEGKTAHSWYRRYRQHTGSSSSGSDGGDGEVSTHPREREKLLNIETSFLSSDCALWGAEGAAGDAGADAEVSVFDALFAAD